MWQAKLAESGVPEALRLHNSTEATLLHNSTEAATYCREGGHIRQPRGPPRRGYLLHRHVLQASSPGSLEVGK